MTVRRTLFLLLPLFIVSLLVAQPERRRTVLIRIDNVKPDVLQRTGILSYDEYESRSIISVVRDTAYVIVTPAELALLRERGFTPVTIMEDSSELTLIRRAAYGPSLTLQKPYHTHAEILQELATLERTYPSLVQRRLIGTTSQTGQPISAVKLSRNVTADDARPTLLLNGCHHSNELLGAEICLAAAQELVTRYGTDPDITRWMDQFQIFVIPVVNVDGHDVVTSGRDPRWRKNTRDTDGNGRLNFPDGIDLNRNYDFNWAHGGSGEPASGRYRGRLPFSEAEPRAIAELARQQRFLISLTYHSQGEVIFYPWMWGGRKAPDDALLTDIARDIAGSIRTMQGDTCYRAEYGAGLVGQSYPWLYGRLGTFDFVVETGRGASFVPQYEVGSIVRENLKGIRTMFRRAEGPGLAIAVTDATNGAPLEATVWFPAVETEDIDRRTSHPKTGVHYRLLQPGAYTVHVSRPGYAPLVLDTLTVAGTGWTRVSAALSKAAAR